VGKVVFIDDNSYTLAKVKDELALHHEVFLALNFEMLSEIVETVEPNIILLNINMFRGRAYDVINKIKADKKFTGVPVVFLASKIDNANVLEWLSIGAADVVQKPVSDTKLITSIENQLDQEKRSSFRPKVLAVDDSPSILKSINYVLNCQYSVHALSEPESLTKLLSKIKPDLFLLDYNMPNLTGFELIPIIRNYEELATTPIIFLTSEKRTDKISEAIALGAVDYITKPINPEVLRRKIATQMVDILMCKQHAKANL